MKALLMLTLCFLAPQQDQDQALREKMMKFRQELKEVGKLLDEQQAKSEAMFLEGRCREANQALLDVLPEEDRTAAQNFVLGNLLFSLDHERSYELHRKAFDVDPDNPWIALEWALHQHRRKNYEEAEKLYGRFLEVVQAPDPKVTGLRTDCLVHLGRYREAVEAWKSLDPESHSSVETGASWVYGKVHPCTRRSAMLEAVRAGDLSKFEELIYLDLEWDRDWWNDRKKGEYLAHDLVVAAGKLGAGSRRFKELELLAKSHIEHDTDNIIGGEPETDLDSEEFAAELKSLGILGKKPKLPHSSLVANHVFSRMIDEELISAEALLEAHEKELIKRIESAQGDAEACGILAALYQNTGSSKLEELNRLGWKKYGSWRCAGSLLNAKGDRLKSDDPDLLKALEDFPLEKRITIFAFQCAQRESKPLEAALARQIMAEFSSLFSAHDGLFYCMQELEKVLEKEK